VSGEDKQKGASGREQIGRGRVTRNNKARGKKQKQAGRRRGVGKGIEAVKKGKKNSACRRIKR